MWFSFEDVLLFGNASSQGCRLGDKEVTDAIFDCHQWSRSPLPPWTWCIGGFFWKHTSRNAKLKVHGWLPRGMLISHSQSGYPQRWSHGQHPWPHSVPARMDLLFPAGHGGWVWLLSPKPHIVLSVSGLRICRRFIPWAPPHEALLGLLPDSLLRAKNIPFPILFLVTQSCPNLLRPHGL